MHARPRSRTRRSLATWLATGLGTALTAIAWQLPNQSTLQPAAVRLYHWPGGVPPIGVALSGLQNYIVDQSLVRSMDHQIWSARYFWRANTVRFQILQDRLVGASGRYLDRAYLDDIRAVTNYALRQGLTVVLNAQTEMSMGYAVNESLPDKATAAFWMTLSRYYRNNPHVVYDLLNEPRRCGWPQWQAGFQWLIDYLRARGVDNQFWVEGINWGSTLAGAPLLHGRNIVYSFHHPGAPWPWQSPVNAQAWQADFGYLADEGIPVVDGEFANYTGSYDWAYPELRHANTTRLVREYLAFLSSHHVGMLAWSEIPGALNRNVSYTSVSQEPQGDGALVKAWFAGLNTRYTHSKFWAAIRRDHHRQYAGRKIGAHYCTPYGGAPKRYGIQRCPRRHA